MSIETLENIKYHCHVAVVHWDNGTTTTVYSGHTRDLYSFVHYDKDRLQRDEIMPLIRSAQRLGVHPVEIDWFEDVITEVVYKTRGRYRSFKKSERYPQEKK